MKVEIVFVTKRDLICYGTKELLPQGNNEFAADNI